MRLFKHQNKEQKQEEERIKLKMERIKAAKPDEKYRAPNPCQCVFPEENFIDMTVLQENKPIKLQTYRHQPIVKPRAIVFMFHGLCAHMNHGAHIAKELADIGCIVVGFDHRGFGKSEGIRGYLESIPIHLHDSKEFVFRILSFYENQNIKNIPIFMMGLSMGGMTSFRLSIELEKQIPIRGVVLFAPAIKPIQGKATQNLAKTLGKFAPKLKLVKGKGGKVTKNPAVSEALRDDPYTYKEEMLPGTANSILQSMVESEKLFPQFRVSWLLVQGGLDKLVDPDVAHDLYEQSQSVDKQVLFYDDCWHDIWHEQEILDALPKVIHWIQERVK